MVGEQPQEAARTLLVALSRRSRAFRQRASVGPDRRHRCSTALCIELSARHARPQPSFGSTLGGAGLPGGLGGRDGAGLARSFTRFSSTARSAMSTSADASAMWRSRSAGGSSGDTCGGCGGFFSSGACASETGSTTGVTSLFCWAGPQPGPSSAAPQKNKERCKAREPASFRTNRSARPSPRARLAFARASISVLRLKSTRWG